MTVSIDRLKAVSLAALTVLAATVPIIAAGIGYTTEGATAAIDYALGSTLALILVVLWCGLCVLGGAVVSDAILEEGWGE